MEATEENHLTIVTTRTEKVATAEAAHASHVNQSQDAPPVARRDIYGFPIPSTKLACVVLIRLVNAHQK